MKCYTSFLTSSLTDNNTCTCSYLELLSTLCIIDDVCSFSLFNYSIQSKEAITLIITHIAGIGGQNVHLWSFSALNWCVLHICLRSLEIASEKQASFSQEFAESWQFILTAWHWCLSGCRVKAERCTVIYWVGLLQREAGRIKCSHLESEARCGQERFFFRGFAILTLL